MTFLLDTNVVSEWVKPKPEAKVLDWLSEVDEDRVFLSVVTLAEIRRGIELLPIGRRRQRLEVWLSEELPQRFDDRVIPIDAAIGDAWGKIVARRQMAGNPVSVIDAFLAATCVSHGMTLVTRNTSHFSDIEGAVFNPWHS